ncbi:MAG: MFS transporter [Rhodospirillales bacterium]|nr:MFS transporter [Rhodospirillales bacterium]
MAAPKAFRAPKIIKRNVTLFALSQSFNGAGIQLAYGFGPLMVLSLTGETNLAGLTVGIIGLSRFLIAYTAGRITDQYGRKPGILLGLVLALVGGQIIGTSMIMNSITMFVIGLLIFGMGMNAAQQLRVAATDMFPPSRRAQALGYVALGSLVGLIVTPSLVTYAQWISDRTELPALGLPWFMLPGLIIPGMMLIYFVRPDPKEIGMNLEKYYPGYVRPKQGPKKTGKFRPTDLLRSSDTRIAIISNCAAHGNMSIVMVLTSLVLSHHGYSLPAIAFSHMFHSAGMFAFTIPLGRLADRWGRQRVMLWGVATAFSGAAFVAFTSWYATVTLGTFLVCLGWAAANVAATALIADRAETQERGRAIGTADSFAGATSVVMALITGPLIENYGLPMTGLVAAAIALPPLVLILMTRGKGNSLAPEQAPESADS